MKMFTKLCILAFIATGMSSCYVERSVEVQSSQYLYNSYERLLLGKSENQILQSMGAADRTLSDGAGGKILRYENRKLVTNSIANSSSSTSSTSGAVAGYNSYGNPVAYGASSSNTNYGYASNTTTSEQVNYVECFIRKDGSCYKVRANVGDVYSSPKYGCVKVANKDLLLLLIPPCTLVGIPICIWYLKHKNEVQTCY